MSNKKEKKKNDEDEMPLFVEVIQLRTGKSFGEIALIKNKPRQATIQCIEDCHFATMSQSDYEKILVKIE
jgi:CRP-like cAMP-binding protein